MKTDITSIPDFENQINHDNISQFSTWISFFLTTYKKPFVDDNTYRFSYDTPTQRHLIPFFGCTNLDQIKPMHVQKFFSENAYLSQSELNKLHMILVAAYRAAIDNGVCKRSPMTYINYKSHRPKNVKHVYTDKEIKIVEEYSFFDFPEITFFLETGIRRGELCGLKKSDLHLSNKSFLVNRSIAEVHGGGIKEMPPKWNSYRELPLSPMAMRILAFQHNNSPYVFPNRYGKAQSPTSLYRKLKKFMKKVECDCNCPALTAHELRHTYGTMLRRNDVDIYTIQVLMGHKDINITANTYVHNEIEVLKRALGYSL